MTLKFTRTNKSSASARKSRPQKRGWWNKENEDDSSSSSSSSPSKRSRSVKAPERFADEQQKAMVDSVTPKKNVQQSVVIYERDPTVKEYKSKIKGFVYSEMSDNLREWYIKREMVFSVGKCRFEEANRIEIAAHIIFEAGKFDEDEINGIRMACMKARENTTENENQNEDVRAERRRKVITLIRKALYKRWTNEELKDLEERFRKRSSWLMSQPAFRMAPCGKYMGMYRTHNCKGFNE